MLGNTASLKKVKRSAVCIGQGSGSGCCCVWTSVFKSILVNVSVLSFKTSPVLSSPSHHGGRLWDDHVYQRWAARRPGRAPEFFYWGLRLGAPPRSKKCVSVLSWNLVFGSLILFFCRLWWITVFVSNPRINALSAECDWLIRFLIGFIGFIIWTVCVSLQPTAPWLVHPPVSVWELWPFSLKLVKWKDGKSGDLRKCRTKKTLRSNAVKKLNVIQ